MKLSKSLLMMKENPKKGNIPSKSKYNRERSLKKVNLSKKVINGNMGKTEIKKDLKSLT